MNNLYFSFFFLINNSFSAYLSKKKVDRHAKTKPIIITNVKMRVI